MTRKVKNIVICAYVIEELNNIKIKTESRVEKVIKRKGNKLYIKWKSHNNSFNSWIDKKYIIIRNELLSRTI